jgi:hypothetical protein
MPGKMRQVSVGDRILGVDRFNNSHVFIQNVWSPLLGSPSFLASGNNMSTVGLHSNGSLMYYHQGRWNITNIPLSSVAVGSWDYVFGTTASGQVYQISNRLIDPLSAVSWKQEPLQAFKISTCPQCSFSVGVFLNATIFSRSDAGVVTIIPGGLSDITLCPLGKVDMCRTIL